jgi:hypothetical protein
LNDRVEELLEELVAWARFANRQSLVSTLKATLSDDRHFAAYDLTDGTRTQREIANETGLGQSTVSGLWVRWKRMGLAREKDGTVVHLVKPSDVGLERSINLRSTANSKTKLVDGRVPDGEREFDLES